VLDQDRGKKWFKKSTTTSSREDGGREMDAFPVDTYGKGINGTNHHVHLQVHRFSSAASVMGRPEEKYLRGCTKRKTLRTAPGR